MATSTVPAVKAAVFTMLTTACTGDDVLVCWGDPDYLADDIVAVQGATATATVATMGSNRSREERWTLFVTVSCYRGGGAEVQQLVTERAYTLFGQVEAALRADPTATGTARQVIVAGHEMVESISVDESTASMGRVCEIVARLEVQARI